MAKSLGANSIIVQGDSQLIISQVNGTCEAKEERIYLSKVRKCIKGFTIAKFHQILREENMEANSLAKAAYANELVDDQIKV